MYSLFLHISIYEITKNDLHFDQKIKKALKQAFFITVTFKQLFEISAFGLRMIGLIHYAL